MPVEKYCYGPWRLLNVVVRLLLVVVRLGVHTSRCPVVLLDGGASMRVQTMMHQNFFLKSGYYGKFGAGTTNMVSDLKVREPRQRLRAGESADCKDDSQPIRVEAPPILPPRIAPRRCLGLEAASVPRQRLRAGGSADCRDDSRPIRDAPPIPLARIARQRCRTPGAASHCISAYTEV